MNSPYSRSNDEIDFEFELTVKGKPACFCCNQFQAWIFLAAICSFSASTASIYFIATSGIPLYSPAIHGLIGTCICFVIGLGSRFFVVRANERGLRVDYGPCPCYQRCLCCGCCVPRSRGETSFEAITSVQLVERSQCLDGCGITENRCNNIWVFNVACCVPSVVITRRYDPTQGCCAYTNMMLGLDSREQAQELISYLEEKISKNHRDVEHGSAVGTFERPMPAHGLSQVIAPTAPPTYDSVQSP